MSAAKGQKGKIVWLILKVVYITLINFIILDAFLIKVEKSSELPFPLGVGFFLPNSLINFVVI